VTGVDEGESRRGRSEEKHGRAEPISGRRRAAAPPSRDAARTPRRGGKRRMVWTDRLRMNSDHIGPEQPMRCRFRGYSAHPWPEAQPESIAPQPEPQREILSPSRFVRCRDSDRSGGRKSRTGGVRPCAEKVSFTVEAQPDEAGRWTAPHESRPCWHSRSRSDRDDGTAPPRRMCGRGASATAITKRIVNRKNRGKPRRFCFDARVNGSIA